MTKTPWSSYGRTCTGQPLGKYPRQRIEWWCQGRQVSQSFHSHSSSARGGGPEPTRTKDGPARGRRVSSGHASCRSCAGGQASQGDVGRGQAFRSYLAGARFVLLILSIVVESAELVAFRVSKPKNYFWSQPDKAEDKASRGRRQTRLHVPRWMKPASGQAGMQSKVLMPSVQVLSMRAFHSPGYPWCDTYNLGPVCYIQTGCETRSWVQ